MPLMPLMLDRLPPEIIHHIASYDIDARIALGCVNTLSQERKIVLRKMVRCVEREDGWSVVCRIGRHKQYVHHIDLPFYHESTLWIDFRFPDDIMTL